MSGSSVNAKISIFEQKICEAFMARFSGSGSTMRLRAAAVIPGFDDPGSEEKELWTTAAENLEKRGILRLKREQTGKTRQIRTMTCLNFENLYEAAEKKHPGTEAEKIRMMVKNALPGLEKKFLELKRKNPENRDREMSGPLPERSGLVAEAENTVAFLGWLAVNFSLADAKRGMDSRAAEDFLRLSEIFLEPEIWESLTTRALSVRLYRDSKRLEYVMDFASPFLSQAQKQGVTVPDFSLLRRSFPETAIAGKLVFEFRNPGPSAPMINAEGIILSLPLSSIPEIGRIQTLLREEKPSVLTVENKETFFILASPKNRPAACSGAGDSAVPPQFNCWLYTGGFPNRATAAMIRLLAASGFSFHHAGDLDIDGVLILQNIMDIAGKPVTPFRMDSATFDRCLPWARPLGKEMFRQAGKIREETLALPGIADLIHRIEETCRGVEQEIIDY